MCLRSHVSSAEREKISFPFPQTDLKPLSLSFCKAFQSLRFYTNWGTKTSTFTSALKKRGHILVGCWLSTPKCLPGKQSELVWICTKNKIYEILKWNFEVKFWSHSVSSKCSWTCRTGCSRLTGNYRPIPFPCTRVWPHLKQTNSNLNRQRKMNFQLK